MSRKGSVAGFGLAALISIALLGVTTAQESNVAAGTDAGSRAAANAGSGGAANAERGNARFQHSCAPCHAAGLGDDGREMLPGTAALEIKYRGALPAVLEQRSDLTPEALRIFLRQGSMSMPPFRPTELTDAEIRDIAAYLAESSATTSQN